MLLKRRIWLFKRILCVLCIFYRGCVKTSLNAFYNVLLELVFGSGCSAAVPGLFPGYPRQAVLLVLCLALVRQIMPGGGASMGSRWRSVPDRLAVPGMVPGWVRTPRKCTTSQKPHQNRVGLNRKNLKKIAEI